MDLSCSDEELDFIKRPPPIYVGNVSEGDGNEMDVNRPATPPMDDSLKLSKSLGLIFSPHSPPCRRIRSMKLIESPAQFGKNRLQPVFTSTPTASSPCLQHFYKRIVKTAPRSARPRNFLSPREKSATFTDNSVSPSSLINPLSTSKIVEIKSKKRLKSKCFRTSTNQSFTFESDENQDSVSPTHRDSSHLDFKKPRLTDFNVPRYQQEFLELEVIGSGDHGCVFRCLNRLNGVEYAVKRSIWPINNEKVAHNEIYAHAVLEHPNIVRNYSSWTENDYLFMQNEYCNGGSLEDLITSGPLEERTLRKILEHIAQGLRFIHSKNLAHMDIKPGNILLHRDAKMFYKPYEIDEFCDDENSNEETIYKIGDLGHVTRLDEVVDLEEGDCRYLPKEILQDDYSHLDKVDIFALGLTLYQAAGAGPLPKNGDEWHNIRSGRIKQFPNLGNDFNDLIKRMIHPDPNTRPTASDLLSQNLSSPIYKTVKDKHELKAAKQKIQLLEQQLACLRGSAKYIQRQIEHATKVGGSPGCYEIHRSPEITSKSRKSPNS
ncbi:wee1-like protein kinase isoform X2 [Cimex lectularius]|uniref:Protein kinase domain-containing protein n=1 Tax=Cimex lectularius TaxID=79782 RepID=A0A8I6S6R0_CIMLE|nr:wee1-like protein kinase isoform X2 [Cimex lectularius]